MLMTRYIIRRAIQSFILMWFTTLIAFSIYQLAPGGPLQFICEDPSKCNAKDLPRLSRLYGLDRSILAQYLTWVAGEDLFPATPTWRTGRCLAELERCGHGVLRLDFGRSLHFSGESVIDLIVERMPATFILGFSGLVLSVLGGVPLGIISALYRGRWPDQIIRVTTVLLSSLPSWWLGLVSLLILGGYFRIVPLGGMQEFDDGSLLDRLHHLILPALVSAIGGWIGFSRILRFEMLEVLNSDYVRTAYAKGLSRYQVVIRHVLPNAIMPFVTGLGGIYLIALSGSVLFETVFSWPGMGRLVIIAIGSKDYPLLMAFFVITSFLGILGLLTVDILYSFVDPKVRYDINE